MADNDKFVMVRRDDLALVLDEPLKWNPEACSRLRDALVERHEPEPNRSFGCPECGGQGVVWGVTDSDLEPCPKCGEDDL